MPGIFDKTYLRHWCNTHARLKFAIIANMVDEQQREIEEAIHLLIEGDGYSCFEISKYAPGINTGTQNEQREFLSDLKVVLGHCDCFILPTIGNLSPMNFIVLGAAWMKTYTVLAGPPIEMPWNRLANLRLSDISELTRFIEILERKQNIALPLSRLQAAAMYFPQED